VSTPSNTSLISYRVVEQLVELASTPDEQVEYFDRHHWDGWYGELLLSWLNWSADMLPQLEQANVLSPEAVRTTKAVTEALWSLDGECAAEYRRTKSIQAFTEDGVRHDPRWEAIRVLARQALAAFLDMGIPTPRLSDDDYNVRRDDGPGHRCPVCGYPNLTEQPHSSVSGGASDEICPSCGFQFGFDDDDRHIRYEEWRGRWVSDGMRWFSAGKPQPSDWDPIGQLRSLDASS
jgi:hypothetical protein